MGLKRDKNLKLYYSIGEVSQIVGVAETTLRFWEREFPDEIKPHKAGRGIRQYTIGDIDVLKKIHHLIKEKGMTLDGVRNLLKHKSFGTDLRLDVLTRLKSVRDELQAISRELSGLV